MTLHPKLLSGIEDVRDAFGASRVTAVEPGDGTAIVTVAGFDIGSKWKPSIIELTVLLAVTFPATPPYPFYATADLCRADGGTVSNMTAGVSVGGKIYSQLSLTNRPMRADETLSERLLAAVAWFRAL